MQYQHSYNWFVKVVMKTQYIPFNGISFTSIYYFKGKLTI